MAPRLLIGAQAEIPVAFGEFPNQPIDIPEIAHTPGKVAICDQVEDPKQARTLVRREVVRVVTPGTVVDDDLLNARENNFIAAVTPGAGQTEVQAWGLALADLSTGEFLATEGETPAQLAELLAVWRPRELLVPDEAEASALVMEEVATTRYDAYRFDPPEGDRALREHLGVATLEGFGLAKAPLAMGAAGALAWCRTSKAGSSAGPSSTKTAASATGTSAAKAGSATAATAATAASEAACSTPAADRIYASAS